MSLEDLIAEIRRRAAEHPSLGHTVKIEFEEGGAIFWDGTVTPAAIGTGDGEAETTLRLTTDNLRKIMEGDLDPTMAYMMGKLKIEGSLGVALKISGYLGE